MTSIDEKKAEAQEEKDKNSVANGTFLLSLLEATTKKSPTQATLNVAAAVTAAATAPSLVNLQSILKKAAGKH